MTKIKEFSQKTNFVIHVDWYEAIKLLTQEQKGDLLDAFFLYHIEGKTPDPKSSISLPFMFLKPAMDATIRYYKNIHEKNKEVGKLGGRPKKTERLFEKPSGYFETHKRSIKEEEEEKEKEEREKPKKTHTPNFLNLLEKELLFNETSNSSFVGSNRYQNKVLYFIDKNREKLEAKQDLADAMVHFRNFYKNLDEREAGERYVRKMTFEEEKEVCQKISDYLKDNPQINKGLTDLAIKRICWQSRNDLIKLWQNGMPERIVKFFSEMHLSDEQIENLNTK